MPVYEYKAVTKNGKVIADKMNIEGSEQVVKSRLIESGLKPISIKKKAFDVQDTINKMKPKQMNKKAAIALDDEEIKGQNLRKEKVKKQKKKFDAKSAQEILKMDVNHLQMVLI